MNGTHTNEPYRHYVIAKGAGDHIDRSEEDKKKWKNLEKDVQLEEEYLHQLFHDKHDYSHLLDRK